MRPSRQGRVAICGLLIGAFAGLAMTLVMLLLASGQIATPLVLLGDRLSIFISPGPFLRIMGKVGGYNHLKMLGVASTALGQILVGALGGFCYAFFFRSNSRQRVTLALFVALPLLVSALLLWPVLGTHYGGLPIEPARLITLVTLALSFLVFERVLVLGFDFIDSPETVGAFERKTRSSVPAEYTPSLGRRAFVLGAAGLLVTAGIFAATRRLFRLATFSYDGTQYKGPGVQPITPNEQFYCVTKNVIDPRVDADWWHLEVGGLVQNPRTYRLLDLKNMTQVDQETTLMCISNGLDAGLMSNAMWGGLPMVDLIQAAGPLASAKRVKLHGVDNYTDTFPLEKALKATTLIAFRMNGELLPHRHGFPARAIVPGYFGEKHVKWLTRIELAREEAKGFYEAQGWGPDFIVPTRSRIDVPVNESWIKRAEAKEGLLINGVAFAGDRGVARVEVSTNDGGTWSEATLEYPGTKLTWTLWSLSWRPQHSGDYTLVVRATDGEGEVQEFEEDRAFTSGVTGFHKIVVHVFG